MRSFRDPRATWLGSPNFTPDRDGHDVAVPPSWVVLHTMVGTVASANARFQQASEQASAHYGVGLDGSLVQWVDEKDAAWTNGNSGVEGATGRNEDSITIEHEDGGDFNGPRTPALYATSALLVREVCLRYGLPIDREHVIGHRECTGNSPTSCPDALDVDRIVRVAASPVVTVPPGGDVAAAHRFDDNATDVFVGQPDGRTFHYVWFKGQGDFSAPDDLGGNLIPHTHSAWWSDAGTRLTVVGMAPSGQLFKNVWDGKWSGWLGMSASGAPPSGGAPSLVPHHHDSVVGDAHPS